MTREIKFRGKDYLGDWCFGMLSADLKHIVTNKADSAGRSIDVYREIDPKTVGQYIGIQDRDGKDIYEGDILMFYPMRPDILQERHLVGSCIGYGFCQWEYIDKEDRKGVCCRIKRQEPCTIYGIENGTVVGNIHDNPELLKGGEE